VSSVHGVAPDATGTLRWAAGPVSFELVSGDPRVLDRARVVLGPWLKGPSGSTPPKARFLVAANGDVEGGRWRIQREGHEPAIAHSLDHALASVEYGAVAALHEPDSGVVALHAALLSRKSRGVLVVGPKEAGKSTLACALWASGWRLHSDDNALIEAGARARGIPRRVSLRATSRGQLGSEIWDRILHRPGTIQTRTGILFHPGASTTPVTPRTVPVTDILFLARRGATAGPAGLESLDGGRALLGLVPYCNRREAGYERALRDLQPLADRAAAYDLGRGDLAMMVRRVEEITG
jgi:hypothetical protein